MSELKENLKYVNRFAKHDELYDLNYVETVLNTDDESEIFTALKYAHRFAKRQGSYDEDYISDYINLRLSN